MKLDYDKCRHCKYFIQHYNVDCNWIWKVRCGHCSKNVSPKGFRLYSGKQPCPHFEQNKGQKERIKKDKIENLLQDLSVNIEFIKLYLNKNKKQTLSNTMIDWLDNKN